MSAELAVLSVGAGYFSRFHQMGWRATAGARVVAIVDRDVARARAQADAFGVPRVFADLHEALDATRPDLVDAAVPPAAHREVVEACLARGVPTICQKPFGRDWAEAVALAAQAARRGVPLIVHENFRFQPWIVELRRLIDVDALGGAPWGLTVRVRPGDGQGPRAYLDRQPYFQRMPRFLVRETLIHFIDVFRFLVGEVDAVSARLRRLNPAIDGEDAGVVLLEAGGNAALGASGALGTIDANRLNEHVARDLRRTMGELWLEGPGGVLRLDGDARLSVKPHGGAERTLDYDRGPDDAFGGGACGRLQAHVVAHLVHGTPLHNDATAYLANLRVQEAAYRSHAEGRRIGIAGFDPGAG